MYEGNLANGRVLFVSDYLRRDEADFHQVLSDKRKEIVVNALNRAGIPESEYAFTCLYPFYTTDLRKENPEKKVLAGIACKELIKQSGANVIVPLGESALQFLTGFEGIENYHCNVLKVKAEFGSRKAIPLLHPEHIQRVWEDSAYMSFGCQRIKQEYHSKEHIIESRKFLLSLDLTFEQIVSYLEDVVLKAPEISTDIETGRGVINTQGFAVSPYEAIAIDVLPSSYKPSEFHKLWSLIGQVLESDIPKIAQNAIYESQWASKYGIQLNNVAFDTMTAMKLLHPTLAKGLDNVGRIYTNFPYWKGDHSDWNNVRNWRDHLIYNCKDTTGQFAAKINMNNDLQKRGLDGDFHNYMGVLYAHSRFSTDNGISISEEKFKKAKGDVERDLSEAEASFGRECESGLGRQINANSPKQVKGALKELGIRVPTKKGMETVGKEALVKMLKANPKCGFLQELIKVNKLSNQIDAYFNFNYDADKRIRFNVDICHNEYGEWSSGKNPFGSGFSLDDVPKKTRGFMVADEGHKFLEITLHQAELKYLAYDSRDLKMIQWVDGGVNIPEKIGQRFANKAFIHPMSADARAFEEAVYAAAYGMSVRGFVTKLAGEHQYFLSETEGRRLLQVVHELFPGLRKRQDRIAYALKTTRTLKNDLGRTIIYYDRINDDLMKRALQWPFRSLKAGVLNNLMLQLQHQEVYRTNDRIWVHVKENEIFNNIEYLGTPVIASPLKPWNFSLKFRAGDSLGNMKDPSQVAMDELQKQIKE